MPAQETWGIRDQRISERHRAWGVNVPCADLDLLLLEFDGGRAVALIEYKHERGAHLDDRSAGGRALIDLGQRAGLPVYSVRYADDFAWLEVKPLNSRAALLLQGAPLNLNAKRFSEADYIVWLHRLRGRKVDA